MSEDVVAMEKEYHLATYLCMYAVELLISPPSARDSSRMCHVAADSEVPYRKAM